MLKGNLQICENIIIPIDSSVQLSCISSNTHNLVTNEFQ